MNWGKGIIIVLIIFIGFISVLAFLMMRSTDDNFDKDYYEKGLAYTDEYNQRQQVIDDHAQPHLILATNELIIQFKGAESGIITIKRPSNSNLDQQIHFIGKKVLVPLNDLKKGDWLVVMKWKNKSKNYWFEKEIFLP
ncbi:MAG: FixH family protein [Sphingobacteriales bacterium]|nr:FixH family protein [Sphingobacteriales bacterium]